MTPDRRQAGFTLIEMIVVMVITSILAGMASMFIVGPVESYLDTVRRNTLTGTADLALARIGRDLQRALPHSVRVTSNGGKTYLEYLEVRSGGSYRTDTTGALANDEACTAASARLEFTLADTCLRSKGEIPLRSEIVSGDFLVIANAGTTGLDAYENGAVTGGNKARITATADPGTGEDSLAFESITLQTPSPGERFHVVSGPVTYVCDPTAGSLRRYWGYAIQAAQPNDTAAAPLAATSQALIANAVSQCAFVLPAAGTHANLVGLSLTLTQDGESATYYQGTHVTNRP